MIEKYQDLQNEGVKNWPEMVLNYTKMVCKSIFGSSRQRSGSSTDPRAM